MSVAYGYVLRMPLSQDAARQYAKNVQVTAVLWPYLYFVYQNR
jgi:hypothetical protein